MINEAQLEKGRKRGRLALYAGIFLVVFVCAVWIWLDRLFATNAGSFSDPASLRLIGHLNVAFGLLEVAGAIGIVNGAMTSRSGRPNVALVVILVILAIAALFTLMQA